ncbi:unnamed protein product [Medioppia subpectinata]|uniref:Uncharacterized protein n=1 Tax=Medioppia subpectinata TaxID=1979941 RepID=A0A7R9QMG5_9ACAR|nr:unnamed protein product [Medioppia subpectinata]CAG2123447.1 unnamed protein product [Medioppia subpectinata]
MVLGLRQIYPSISCGHFEKHFGDQNIGRYTQRKGKH